MATDWAADVKKYAPNADDGVIAGIVRYCGIALRKVDSSLVAFSDKKETDRVRENFLKKKLGLTQAEKTLDAAIAKVGKTMKADRTKNRVTVYYLLAENFKKLDLFAPKAKTAAKVPAKKSAGAAALAGAAGLAAAASAKPPAAKKAAPAKKAPAVATTRKVSTKKVAIKAAAAPQGLMDKAAGAGTAAVAGTVAAAGAVAATAVTAAASATGAAKDTAVKVVDVAGDAVAGAAGLAAGAADKASSAVTGAISQLSGTADDEDSGLGWLLWLLFAALVAFVLWWVLMRGAHDGAAATTEAAAASTPAPAAPVDLAAAPAEGTVAIPAGAGVTSELRNGKPVVKVYFDTGKTAVVPAFGDAAAGFKAYLDGHAGSSLQISGFNDPTGGAAVNARLAKGRAEAVGAALVASGIPQTAVALVKPEAATDASTDLAGARRVEVTIK